MLGERVIGFAERGAVMASSLLHDDLPKGCESVHAEGARACESAWEILARVTPALHTALRAATRHVVIFSEPGSESFATPAAPGSVFINVAAGGGVVCFVEELAHQGGHNVFHALATEWERFISADRDLPAATLTGEPDDPRTLEVVLHGVFTQSLMCVALGACLEADALAHDDRQQHELLGRLSFAMRRLQLDLTDVRRRDLYTEAGEELVIAFEEAFDDVYRAASGRITGFNLTNQPYAFSYDRFAALNA